MEEKHIWYFTFGSGYNYGEFRGKCQPIRASSFESARSKMFELHGDKWAFQYSEEEWNKLKNDPNRVFVMEEELDIIEA